MIYYERGVRRNGSRKLRIVIPYALETYPRFISHEAMTQLYSVHDCIVHDERTREPNFNDPDIVRRDTRAQLLLLSCPRLRTEVANVGEMRFAYRPDDASGIACQNRWLDTSRLPALSALHAGRAKPEDRKIVLPSHVTAPFTYRTQTRHRASGEITAWAYSTAVEYELSSEGTLSPGSVRRNRRK